MKPNSSADGISDGSLVKELRKQFDLETPCLVLREDRISYALELFNRFLPHVKLFYAIKANPAKSLLTYFRARGLGLDVSSLGEINLAIASGFEGSELILSTPTKTLQTIEAMFANKLRACVVDGLTELERIAAYRLSQGYDHAPEVFVRLKVESTNVEVNLNTKFGCSITDAIKVIERIQSLGLTPAGVCFHVGTKSISADNYFVGIESAMLVAKEVWRRFAIKLPVINIGGGFCDPATASKAGVKIEQIFKEIGQACKMAEDEGFQIFAEPGRCLIAAAGTAITSVIGISRRENGNWAYLDDGLYGCYSLKLYEQPEFEFNLLSQPSSSRRIRPLNNPEVWTLAGPTCDSLDVIASNAKISASLEVGDIIYTPNMGAYTLSTACQFNGFTAPECYLVSVTNSGGRISVEILRPELKALTDQVANSRN